MNSQVFEEKSIKLSGLVTKDYCILASLSDTPLRTGTLWTNKDSKDYYVISKNHHRRSDEESQISIIIAPGNIESSAETTATAMFEVISVDDRYETTNRVTYKDYSHIGDNQWNATVYGGPGLKDETPKIDPYVMLTEHQCFLSARVNDSVRDPQSVRIVEKRYTKLDPLNYHIMFRTANTTYNNINSTYNKNDLFRTLSVGDHYQDLLESSVKVWIVKEKRVFYMETIGEVDFYGREIFLISST